MMSVISRRNMKKWEKQIINQLPFPIYGIGNSKAHKNYICVLVEEKYTKHLPPEWILGSPFNLGLGIWNEGGNTGDSEISVKVYPLHIPK